MFKRYSEDFGLPQIKLLVHRNKINIEKCRIKIMLQWVHNIKEMIEKYLKYLIMIIGDTSHYWM